MWLDDVNARARGLATHLFDRPRLLSVLEAGTRHAAVRRAIDLGLPLEPALALADVDRAIGQLVALRLGILRRWLGPRSGALAAVFEDEDLRSLRILLRGAAHGSPPAARLAALVPTPTLSERTLDRLSRAASPAALGALLVRAGHPAGRAITEALDPRRRRRADTKAPGLFGLELALARVFAARARWSARRAGREVERYVASLIDRENAWALLTVADWSKELEPELAFLEGGLELPRPDLVTLARTCPADRIRPELARRLAGGPLRGVFDDDPTARDDLLEARALAARVGWYRAHARRDPLGPCVLFSVVERIRT
ncbi:MAG: V-type ATPase subunit, partial [Gemmatimonadales bacterium]